MRANEIYMSLFDLTFDWLIWPSAIYPVITIECLTRPGIVGSAVY